MIRAGGDEFVMVLRDALRQAKLAGRDRISFVRFGPRGLQPD